MSLRFCLVLPLPPFSFSFFPGIMSGSFNPPQFLAGSRMLFVKYQHLSAIIAVLRVNSTLCSILEFLAFITASKSILWKKKELIFWCNTVESLWGSNLNQEVCSRLSFKLEINRNTAQERESWKECCGLQGIVKLSVSSKPEIKREVLSGKERFTWFSYDLTGYQALLVCLPAISGTLDC